MENKIKHKAEPTRHFARYKIPAYIEINGKKYKIKDWSIGGCAILEFPDVYLNDMKWSKANFIIPFDTFDAVIKNITVEFLRKNLDGSIGCRFTDLKPDQISLLQEVIESYLEGTIVTVDNFINVINREDLKEALISRQPAPPQKNKTIEAIKKIFIFSLFLLIFSTLVLFLLAAIYNRIYLIKASSAYYDAPLKIIKTPANGFFKYKSLLGIGSLVKKGEILGFLEIPGNVTFIISSNIEGKIAKVYASDNDAVKVGDPIVAILPKGTKNFVFAYFLHKDLERIVIGQPAKIKDFKGKIYFGKVESIFLNDFSSTTLLNYDKVKISINNNFSTIEDLGKSVEVEIDLTPKFLKPLFKIFESY